MSPPCRDFWHDWLTTAGHADLKPAGMLTLDHFYLSIQAAIDGLGVAMGPTALVSDDLTAGRLLTPFPEISLPARTYFAYLPQRDRINPATAVFCDWLAQQPVRSRSDAPGNQATGSGECNNL